MSLQWNYIDSIDLKLTNSHVQGSNAILVAGGKLYIPSNATSITDTHNFLTTLDLGDFSTQTTYASPTSATITPTPSNYTLGARMLQQECGAVSDASKVYINSAAIKLLTNVACVHPLGVERFDITGAAFDAIINVPAASGLTTYDGTDFEGHQAHFGDFIYWWATDTGFVFKIAKDFSTAVGINPQTPSPGGDILSWGCCTDGTYLYGGANNQRYFARIPLATFTTVATQYADLGVGYNGCQNPIIGGDWIYLPPQNDGILTRLKISTFSTIQNIDINAIVGDTNRSWRDAVYDGRFIYLIADSFFAIALDTQVIDLSTARYKVFDLSFINENYGNALFSMAIDSQHVYAQDTNALSKFIHRFDLATAATRVSCIDNIYFPGNIPASPGMPPTRPNSATPSLDFSKTYNTFEYLWGYFI